LLGSYGLRTYIWNNRLKSLVLLAGFPVLLLMICYAFALVIAAMDNPDVGEGFANATRLLPRLVPVALVSSLVWFVIAWFANQKIVDVMTGAKQIERRAEPRLYNILENLCISRGITMPRLRIIETDAMNAFASGVRRSQYTVTVTRGLMNTLDDAELEAVLAHELTHIENRDVQLLVIAAVFVGIISLVGDLMIRGPRMLFLSRGMGGGGGGTSTSSGWGGSSSSGRNRSGGSRGSGGGGAIVLILVAVAIFLVARLLAVALRMAMSRKREFLADAGSVELTKNPDAMIAALRKIEGHSALPAPAQIQEMYIDHPRGRGLAGLFATHPSIDDRVAALVKFAGGHDIPPPVAPPADAAPTPPAADAPGAAPGPWGSAPDTSPAPAGPATPVPGPWGSGSA
jgi:heat shock protein HtpX